MGIFDNKEDFQEQARNLSKPQMSQWGQWSSLLEQLDAWKNDPKDNPEDMEVLGKLMEKMKNLVSKVNHEPLSTIIQEQFMQIMSGIMEGMDEDS